MWYVALLTRDLRVILVILACLVVSALVGLHSWLRAHRWLGQRRGRMLPIAVHAALAALAGFGIAASWETTRSPADDSLVDRLPGLPHQLRLDREDLIGGNVQTASVQRADFRRTWCALADLPAGLCGTVPAATPYETNRVILDRRAYCRRELGIDGARLVPRCDGYFLDLDRQVRRRLGRGAAREARRPAAARPLGPQPRRRLGRGRQPDRGAAGVRRPLRRPDPAGTARGRGAQGRRPRRRHRLLRRPRLRRPDLGDPRRRQPRQRADAGREPARRAAAGRQAQPRQPRRRRPDQRRPARRQPALRPAAPGRPHRRADRRRRPDRGDRADPGAARQRHWRRRRPG